MRPATARSVIDLCLSELDRFSGPNHEQEDDITLVVLECTQHGAWRLGRARRTSRRARP